MFPTTCRLIGVISEQRTTRLRDKLHNAATKLNSDYAHRFNWHEPRVPKNTGENTPVAKAGLFIDNIRL